MLGSSKAQSSSNWSINSMNSQPKSWKDFFWVVIDKLILKVIYNDTGPKVSKTILKKRLENSNYLFQDLLQSLSNQDRVALRKGQT